VSQNLRKWLGAACGVLFLASLYNISTVREAISEGVTTIRGTVTVLFTTPNGDSMVNDTYDALNVNLVNNDARSAVVTEDGDIPASTATVTQTASVGYCATVAHGSNPTAVAAAGRAGNKCNRAGVPFVIGGHPNVVSIEYTWVEADTPPTDAALVTVSAGTKIVVTQAEVACDADNTASIAVRIGLAASTLSAVSQTPVSGIVISHPDIPLGSGISRGSGAGILAVGADGEDLRITADDTTGGSCRTVVSYYTIES